MKKTYLLLAAILLIASNCSKDDSDEPKTFESNLIGTWIEKYPELFDGISDTIVFTDQSLVKKHIIFDGWRYSATSDTIIFQKNEETRKFQYSITNEKELTIYNFIDRLITQDVKNMQFIKIE